MRNTRKADRHGPRTLPALALVVLGACSTAPAKPDPGPQVESNHKMVNPLDLDDDGKDGMQVEGALGTMDQSAVQAGMSRPMLEITSCFDSRQRNQPYLGGRANLQFRVSREGKVKTVRLQESDLGSLELERCIVAAARGASFERPRGGEAEFGFSVEFQGRIQPVPWDPGMVRNELDENREKLTTIKQGRKTESLVAPSGLTVTMYVNGRGKVVSAGMTAIEEIDDEFATHFVEVLREIKLEQPQGPYAKVTFTW